MNPLAFCLVLVLTTPDVTSPPTDGATAPSQVSPDASLGDAGPTASPDAEAAPDAGASPSEAPAPEGDAAHGLAPTPAPSERLVVEVIALSPEGRIAPGKAEVRLERWRRAPGQAGPSLTSVKMMPTDAEGRASFASPAPLGMGEEDRVVARAQDLEVSTSLTRDRAPGQPVRLVVRRQDRDLSRLRADLRIGLTPLDTVLRVEHFIRFENPTHTVLDTDAARGLRLPLLLPAPLGEPVRGLFPGRPDPNELIMNTQPDIGRLMVERGDVVYRGPIPAEGLTVRVIMAIPYDGQTTHHLGLSSPVELSDLTFIAQSPEHVALTFTLDRPTQLMSRTAQGGEERIYTALTPPGANTPVLLTLGRTPDRHTFMRPLAAGVSIALVAALLLLAAAPRRKR